MERSLSYTHHFAAAHRLPHHEGKCQFVHGHNWIVTVTIFTDTDLDDSGMIIDFKDFKDIVKRACDIFDHKIILWTKDPLRNKLSRQYFDVRDIEWVPTCENLGEYLFNSISSFFLLHRKRDEAFHLTKMSIYVEEAPNQGAKFEKECQL